jgi:hypothetical protein
MDLTDAELTLLLNDLLDRVNNEIRHDTDGLDDAQRAAVDSLGEKAYAEARARKQLRPAEFWWVH